MDNYYIDESKEKRKRMRPRRPRFLFPVIITVCICAVVALTLIFSGWGSQLFQRHKTVDTPSSASLSDGVISALAQKVDVVKPEYIKGVYLRAGVDFAIDENTHSSIDAIIDKCVKTGFNTVIFPVSDASTAFYESSIITTCAQGGLLEYTIEKAHSNKLLVIASIDLNTVSANITLDTSASRQGVVAKELTNIKGLDGIIIDGYYPSDSDISYSDYLTYSAGSGFENYKRNAVTKAVCGIANIIKSYKPELYLGLACDPIWAKASTTEGGFSTDATIFEAYSDGCADTKQWLDKGYFDFTIVRMKNSTSDTAAPFDKVTQWWNSSFAGKTDICFDLMTEQVEGGGVGWNNPDQLTRQLIFLNSNGFKNYVLNSYNSFFAEHAESTAAAIKYLSGAIADDYVLRDLTFTSPAKTSFTTTEPITTIIGASDPEFSLTINGAAVERNELGYFSVELNLKVGKNTFAFTHKGKTVTYSINYRYVVLDAYSPSNAQTLDGGSVLVVTALARNGSTVTATFNGQTINLPKVNSTSDGDAGGTLNESSFVNYQGSFTLPINYDKNISYGKVSFKATCNGVTESGTSGTITATKSERPVVPSDYVAPTGGSYIDVGASLIAEVTKYQAETFDGNTVDDYSRPTNSYLPAGTVDYCSENTIIDPLSKAKYRVLRYGKRCYITDSSGQNIKTYQGTLPNTNNVKVASFENGTKQTKMVLNVDWKAPFMLSILPQNYNNPVTQDYVISSPTFNYIDITFCYAGTFDGAIDVSENPLFSRVELIKNASDYTLRLYLHKTGAFYGWNAEYNSSGQLVFTFLNPTKISSANNSYGVSLSGVKILIDAGHGGSSSGAVGSNPAWDEAALNLLLAQKTKEKLTAIGAEVVMTRTEDTYTSNDTRIKLIKSQKPDLAVSIHRNSSTSANPHGYLAYYFNPYTYNATKAIYNSTVPLYGNSKWNRTSWHYFFLSRTSDCPVVLTENGFISNTNEYSNMIRDAFNDQCADALVKGIVEYFKSIQ